MFSGFWLLSFTAADEAMKRRLATVDLTGDRRSVVRSLALLNELVYEKDNNNWLQYEQLSTIYDTNLNLFKNIFDDPDLAYTTNGRDVFGLEKDALKARNLELATEIEVNPGQSLDYLFTPNSGRNIRFGVGAAKYEDATHRVIIFKGIANSIDYHDLMLTSQGWFLEKMQSDLIKNWQTLYGELPPDTLTRATQTDLTERMGAISGMWSIPVNSPDYSELAYSVDKESLIENGFWKMIKETVREWMPADRDVANEKITYFTGHSQGGMYAQLVSMWLEKTENRLYETVSFGAPGVQCAVRYAMNNEFPIRSCPLGNGALHRSCCVLISGRLSVLTGYSVGVSQWASSSMEDFP